MDGETGNSKVAGRLAHGFTSGRSCQAMVARRVSEALTAIPRSRFGLPLNQQAVTCRVMIGSFQSAARLSTNGIVSFEPPDYRPQHGAKQRGSIGYDFFVLGTERCFFKLVHPIE